MSEDFKIWWHREGSGMPPLKGEEACEHVERVSAIAWSNGAYKATEALKAENARLKTEVERLTAFTTRTIIPNDELQAQVERLTLASQGAVKYVDHTMALTRQSMEHHKQVSRLEAQVERLTKAGDALTEQLEGLGFDSVWDFWNAAKEGKPRD
jgi:predicted RNase H-like nuclease (RuvC/YqgF family)